MHTLRNLILFALVLFVGETCLAQVEPISGGSTIRAFELKDSDGRSWQLADFAESELVVMAFLGTECPLVQLYSSRLNNLQREFSERVQFVGINSNRHDSIREIQHFVRSRQIGFPVLKDVGSRVAGQFGATRTPEVFLLDQNRRVIYQGCIDDQYSYGVQKAKAKNRYLVTAIEAALAGETIETPETEAIGCIIGRRQTPQTDATVTYSKQISRVLQTHCIRCHRDGEIAPFALTEYEEVAGWAEMIEEVVREQRMPPWHADAEPGHFKNDLRLSDAEKKSIYDWVAAGAPEGNADDLPEPIEFAEGWQIGKPDQIIAMNDEPFDVPATGVVPYKYFAIESGFEEDKWVKAAECRPGNRSVVHHIIVGVMGEGEFGEGVHDDLQSEWIAATAPGAPPTILPPGHAKLIPAGSKLVFQMHYTPNGTAQTDLSHIGLIFADPDEVTHRVLTLMAYQDDFLIPAGATDHKVVAKYRVKQPMELLSLFPHMHYRGKSFAYEFRFPDGTTEELLSVPRYDFNWQNVYQLSQTRRLPEGTRLTCTAHFDNSENNLANPDPTKAVSWGDQTWEEMMIGYFNVAVPKEEPLE